MTNAEANMSRHNSNPEDLAPPTQRELDVLHAVLTEKTLKAAAELLFMAYETANTHMDNLRSKSNCQTAAQMVAWVVRNGYWEGDSLIAPGSEKFTHIGDCD
jgi:DNA-binding CsgD family transcriptional regulator